MIELTLKLVLFFLLGIAYFYSLTGYGKILGTKDSNYFDLQLDGTIILLLLSYLIYITIGTNLTLNIIIFVAGLILYLNHKVELNSLKFLNLILSFFLIFSILIISKTHEDFNTYHYFSIFEIFNNNLRIGISNLNGRFFHSSLLTLNQSIIVLPYLNFKLVHLPTFYIYFCTVGYFISVLFAKKLKKDEIFFSILSVLILLVKFNRLSEYGYDYVAQFILLIVFHKIYFLHSEDKQIIKAILYFLLAIIIKPISLFFIPIMFFVLYKKKINFYKKIPKSQYFLILLLSLTLISSSFFKTGCLFYPLNSTCFNSSKVSWSEKNRVSNVSKEVKIWAKSYGAQKSSKYEKITDKELFDKNFNWLKFWVEKHFFYKIFEFLLIILSAIIIITFCFTREKSNFFEFKRDKIVMLFLSFLSVSLWFNMVPQFRFGFALI
ncbi:hypothetical protein N8267_03140, partial [Pelagibacteraceae bacterium]|nr:hypothetical protein [Pelagibacteraceae bacterium]